MPLPSFSYVIPAAGPVVEDDTRFSPLDRAAGSASLLGYGLLRPFQRDAKNDFANAGDERLVKACVGQVLGTKCASDFTQGEVAWNTDFGSLLYLLRHQQNAVALQELARFYVVDALKKWEPRVRVRSVKAARKVTEGLGENQLVLDLVYDVVGNAPGNQVLLADIRQTVTV